MRDAAAPTPLAVNQALSGTAANGADCAGLPGVVTIPADQRTASIDVRLLDYEILSDAAGLTPGGFVSLQSQGVAGFQGFGTPDAFGLSEVDFGDPATAGVDLDGDRSIGLLYDVSADARDLEFGYETSDGAVFPAGQGNVVYVVPEPTGALLFVGVGVAGALGRRRSERSGRAESPAAG